MLELKNETPEARRECDNRLPADSVRLLFTFGVLFLMLMTSACSLSFGGSTADATGQTAVAITGIPVVQFAAPMPNATYLKGVTVNILVGITNAGQDIQRVEIKLGDAPIADLKSPNPSGASRFSVTQTWMAEAAGEYQFTATAFRGNGSASSPVSVKITVIDELPKSQVTDTPTPTIELSPTPPPGTPTPTVTQSVAVTPTTGAVDAATSAAASTATTASSSGEVRVRVIATAGMFVRQGPGTNFPQVGALAGNTELPVLAANPDGSWFKIQFQGGDAWIGNFPNLISVIAGDPTTLPREVGPTPIPATAVPSTSTPAPGTTNTSPPVTGGANLRITGFVLIPAVPGSNQPAKAQININNSGSAASAANASVTLAIANQSDAQNLVSVRTTIPALDPGKDYLVELNFVDTAATGTPRRAVAVVDIEKLIPETSDDDNNSPSIDYNVG